MSLFNLLRIIAEIALIGFVCYMLARLPIPMHPIFRWVIILLVGVFAILFVIGILGDHGSHLYVR